MEEMLARLDWAQGPPRRPAEGPVGFMGRRAPVPPPRRAEVPGMPGHAAQQDTGFSVGYHAGSRIHCSVMAVFLRCALAIWWGTCLQMQSCPMTCFCPPALVLLLLNLLRHQVGSSWQWALPGADGVILAGILRADAVYQLTADICPLLVGQGCPQLISPGDVRLQLRSRSMPPHPVIIQHYWHPQCFPGWRTVPHPLAGLDQLRPRDQVTDSSACPPVCFGNGGTGCDLWKTSSLPMAHQGNVSPHG